ncbi:DUF4209 domain-containing protein [Nocardiopsis alba]|uniref:DUF4209 domain-containing protein n=1 Tax=Nocardiopsis alba TaxID=53437 RepID=UPI00366F01AA
MTNSNVIYQKIENALSGVSEWHEASGKIRNLDIDQDSIEAASIRAAFDYEFPHSEGVDSPFSAMMQTKDGRYPPEIKSIEEPILQIWVSMHEACSLPLVKSRFGDLIWVNKKSGDSYKFAQEAISAYVEMASAGEASIQSSDCLVRALDISLELGGKRTAEVLGRAESYAKHALDNSVQPGIAMRIIERICGLPKKYKAQRGALLRKAEALYSEDPFSVEHVRGLLISLKGNDEQQKQEIARSQVKSWISAADDAESSLVKATHLNRAYEWAQSHNLKIEQEEVRSRIQNLSGASGEMKEISVEFSLPGEDLEKFIGAFTKHDDAMICLRSFSLYCPVKKREEAEAEVNSLIAGSPLQSLVSTVVYNEDYLPIKYVNGGDDYFNYKIRSYEAQSINLWSTFSLLIIDRLLPRLGSTEETSEFFREAGVIDADISGRFSRGIELYREGLYDESLCVVVPRIEAAVRMLARELSVPIFNPPSGDKIGGYKGLGEIISLLKGRIPEEFRVYISSSLSDPLGVNLRNRLSHGILLKGTKSEAALSIHIACLLSSLQVAEAK